MSLLIIALAPIFVLGFYIYYRDKYEKEPFKLLLWTFCAGGISVVPILFVEMALDNYWLTKFSGMFEGEVQTLSSAAYGAFVVAAFTEEVFKFLALYLIIWKHKEFNEKFDGIVYAVFVSLGFAAIENIMYVVSSDISTGVLRAFTAVPAHTIFGIAMGYHFALAKFYRQEQTVQLLKAIIIPILLHGIYDFILMSENGWLLLLFVPYMIYMFVVGLRRIKTHSEASVFKNNQVTDEFL